MAKCQQCRKYTYYVTLCHPHRQYLLCGHCYRYYRMLRDRGIDLYDHKNNRGDSRLGASIVQSG